MVESLPEMWPDVLASWRGLGLLHMSDSWAMCSYFPEEEVGVVDFQKPYP